MDGEAERSLTFEAPSPSASGARGGLGPPLPSERRDGGSAGTLKGLPRRPILADETFDVFFSYNSEDREAVRRVWQALEARGVRAWTDEQIDPGDRWMQKLQEIIAKASQAVIVLGPHGPGPWQEREIEACIAQNMNRKMPVVPVSLPGGPDRSELSLFLASFSWVDLRKGLSSGELDRLARALGAKEITPLPPSLIGSPTRAPRLHNLPFLPLGDLLKGRDEELQRLITNLQSSAQATAITQAIHGLGGIGKTRLAVEYAWRSGDQYDTALFVVADSPEALRSGLASLARPGLLDLPEHEAGAEAKTVEAVFSWLRDHSRWLLILDNIDTDEGARAVREILPRFGNGHVLITSRRRVWPPTIREQSLGELSREEGAQFLLQHTEKTRTLAADDEAQAVRLAETLGGLPLALEQAAAYISHHQMAFAGYLEDWEREREKVLEWHDQAVMDYPVSIAATWQTNFQRLSPKAAAVLRLTAFLAPEPIPEAMFGMSETIVDEATEALREEMGQTAIERTVRDALAELAAYSMVTRSAGNFTVHRVVQEVLRTRIPEDSRRDWIEFSLCLVNGYSPLDPDDVHTWPIWDVLRPHAAKVVGEADRVGVSDPTLMSQLAALLLKKSLYSQAEPLMQRALEIVEASFGPDHPNLAICLNNLAQLFKATNRLSEAEPLMRRALKINETSFGTRHPKVAIRLSNLAQLFQATNRLAEAEPLIRQALEIDEASFGSRHPKVAIRLNNLAQLFQATNRLAEAEPLMRRALEIDEASFGPHHPNVARDLNNLAQLFKVTNRLSEAEPLIRRALETDEASFGPYHPNVARDLNNLASLLQATNRLLEAEPLMRRALEIVETSLGPDHPKTRIVREGLEALFAKMRSDKPA